MTGTQTRPPAAPGVETSVRTSETAPRPPVPKERILVADDDPKVLSVISRALAAPGRLVETAETVAQTKERLQSSAFDLVITDLCMPAETDGMELFRWVKENAPGLDVILISGSPSLDSALEAFRFGSFDYMVKPVDLEVLQHKVSRCLELRRAKAELKTEKALREELERVYRKLSAMDGMRETFRRYLTKEVADKVLASPGNGGMHAERRSVSVLFADIRRFTPFAETRSPEETISALNAVFERLNAAVSRHRGIVSKFTGDGMMVLFGAPLDQPDHAERAVRCALEMQAAVKALNRERAASGEPELQIGVGVSSGDAVAGSLGSIERTEYTVIGSTVNLAARLEERAAAGQVLIAPHTAGEIGAQFLLRSQGLVWIDGFSKSLTVFEVLPT